jgi:ABC-2 type transport system permease protein
MIDAIRSELRKLLTVRSTYIILGLMLLLIIFFAFYGEGIQGGQQLARNRHMLANESLQAISVIGLLGAIVGILLMTHEYRYNMITYSLTASRSRSRVLFAKIIVITLFAIVLSILAGILAPVLTYLGGHVVKGVVMAPQEIPILSILLRVLFVGWGYAMFALLIAALVRSQVGAITAFLFMPVTIEPLLGLLLKHNAIYLPYSALQQVLSPEAAMAAGSHALSSPMAALVALIYIVVGWAVAFVLFIRRDAN